MHYSKINPTDVANGEGVRLSLFVSGCRRNCPGCFNKEAWDFQYGDEFTYLTLQRIESQLSKDYISGLSILGGDPFEPENISWVELICLTAKRMHPEKTIWVWTGFMYEKFLDHPIMEHIDVLVDGPFVEAEKDISLKFRGSSNQRIIDVQKSRTAGKVVLYYD